MSGKSGTQVVPDNNSAWQVGLSMQESTAYQRWRGSEPLGGGWRMEDGGLREGGKASKVTVGAAAYFMLAPGPR